MAEKPKEEQQGLFSWVSSFVSGSFSSGKEVKSGEKEVKSESKLSKKAEKRDALQRKKDVIDALIDDKEVRNNQHEAVRKLQAQDNFNIHTVNPKQREHPKKQWSAREGQQAPRH